MARIIFDTSVWIAYKPATLPNNFLISAVVLQEMTAGATDGTNLKIWEAIYKAYEKKGLLLVPTGEDWWRAGKVLNSLLRDLKSKSGGKTPKLPYSEKHRIVSDVLIAVTAKRAGATLVTNNLADFEKIRRFCAVRIVSGKSYFG